MTLNKKEDLLICLTNLNAIYSVELNNQVIYNNKLVEFKIRRDFHHSRIVDYDTCLQKPFILTCGQENALKLWNYETGQLELNKMFDERIVSASISPNGLYLLISFYNKVNYYSIILNELKCLKTFNLSNISFRLHFLS